MKKTILLFALLFSPSIGLLWAKTIQKDSLSKDIGKLAPIVFLHQKRLMNWQSVDRNTKLKEFEISLDSAQKQIPQIIRQSLFIQQMEVMIIRDGDMIAKTFWQKGQPDPLNNFTQLIKKGDRYIIEFTFAMEDSSGNIIALKNKPVFNLPLL
ncbi:hypothetical protein [Spirosoma linguale]|uniref:Uncharacterized protein n=1 Tax=Spirosoma linguale (strain ATCC 33905 / DSM 74 / LMG 10896 / Claus 1) TaxID=504472 RepID=D2QH75_SPILD|nr:hypothetical protein Slin_0778 [Spirosoma linguale DSM 74]